MADIDATPTSSSPVWSAYSDYYLSPYAKRHFIDHTTYDTTSILRFIESYDRVRLD